MKTIKRFCRLIILFALLICGLYIYRGYGKYTDAVRSLPVAQAVSDIRSRQNYTVYDDIPQFYFDAVVAVEDRRFYKHGGFDVIGTTRAVINDIKARRLLEGGSTITQQLVKNIYFPQDDSIERKIAEIFFSVSLERTYKKKEILELYVNAVYYGSGYYCIYDASMGYFSKVPAKMTEDECTLLAGIPNAPSVYSLDVNPDLARARQQKVIECMKECGYVGDN